LFAWIVRQRLQGDSPEKLAFAFHEGLAEFVLQTCLRVREQSGVGVVALTGGCYQNLLLLELSAKRLRAQGFRVLTHSLVPPNDGGIGLGQAVAAAATFAKLKGRTDGGGTGESETAENN
jgi:hydrogenase maturation protein HypF